MNLQTYYFESPDAKSGRDFSQNINGKRILDSLGLLGISIKHACTGEGWDPALVFGVCGTGLASPVYACSFPRFA